MHYDCPGCSIDTCISLGKELMFQDTYSQCGLSQSSNRKGNNNKNKNNKNKNVSPFTLTNSSEYCTASCQQWIAQLEDMQNVCPHICDEFSDNSTYLSMLSICSLFLFLLLGSHIPLSLDNDLANCQQYIVSLPEFNQWTATYC